MTGRDEGSRPPGGLLAFFGLTFALTEPCFIAVTRMADTPLRGAVLMLGVFAPALVAIGLSWWRARASGVRALLGALTRGRVAARWIAFALLYTPAVKLGAAVIVRLASGAWPRLDFSNAALLPFAIAISTPVQAGEELGWRGYALPRLAARIGLGPASLALGAIWAVWHLPLFFLPGADTFGQSFPVYAAQVVAISVAMAWLYARAGGNLLVLMLFHAAINNTKDLVPAGLAGAHDVFGVHASAVGWTTLAGMWGFAAWCLMKIRRERLDAPPPAVGTTTSRRRPPASETAAADASGLGSTPGGWGAALERRRSRARPARA